MIMQLLPEKYLLFYNTIAEFGIYFYFRRLCACEKIKRHSIKSCFLS